MNVAISRAKDTFWVFGAYDSLSNSKQSASGLLKWYVMKFLELIDSEKDSSILKQKVFFIEYSVNLFQFLLFCAIATECPSSLELLGQKDTA